MEDTEIIRLYWARNQNAISETDTKYGRSCRGIACGIVRSTEDGEECVNDSYLALWNSIPPNRPANFPAYLYRVVRNLSISRLRQLSAAKRGGGEMALMLSELSDCLPSGQSTEQQYEAKELAEEIQYFIRSLSRSDRLIFTARYYLALPVKEIGLRLGYKKSRVCTSLHRSREKLREHLEREGFI